MILLIIFLAILPLLPITRPEAEEGSGTGNGAEGHIPADHTFIPARMLLASSTTSGSAAPNTSIVPLNNEIPRQEPRDRNDAEIPREGPQEGNDDDNVHFKLGKILMGLSIPLAVAQMVVKVQPRQSDSATKLSSLSYILFNTVLATTIFCFVFTMFGMILKKQHLKVGKFCNCIGILLGVLDFFLIISIFADDSMVWLVRVVAVVTLLAAAYILRGEMGIQSRSIIPSVPN